MDERDTETVTGSPTGAGSAARLRRPRSGRVVGGVAAGLAEHLRVDVTLVRVLFVLAALLNLLGALVYGLLWLLVPSEDEADRPGEASGATAGTGAARGVGFWAGVALIAIGAMWLLPWGLTGPLGRGPGSGVLLPLVLLGGGLALWLSDERRGPAGAPTPPADHPVDEPVGPSPGAAAGPGAGPPPGATSASGPPSGVTSGSERRPEAASGPGGSPGSGPPPATPPPPGVGDVGGAGAPGEEGAPPPPARGGSPLVRVTLGLALLVAGALWLAGAVGLTDLRAEIVLGAALLVVGVGLLVGSRWGRGRLLILAGVPLSLLVLITMAAPVVLPVVPSSGTVGRAHVVVEDPADLQEEYEHLAGELLLDLRGLELGRAAETRVAVGAGEVRILLPEELTVEVDAAAGVGELSVLGVRRSGVGPSLRHVDDGDPATLGLEVRVGAGEIVVTRGDPPGGEGLFSPRMSRRAPGATGGPLRSITSRMQEVTG